ncbi:MAG TPA: DUF2652 domain-containing protein [Candidatus Limnocylindrales bacterium]|nr:DUF2652 domain-containing protein [Candidatus Limnocylindrales bacterium]
MSSTPMTGTLLLADLTGYTAYLSGSEIEHAPMIAGDLLETIVGRLEPPFRLSKFEGDAAFLYVEDGRADPSLQLDAIEAAYFSFRRRLRSIDAATACDCNSCRLAPRLDLKLFVHHGQFVVSAIAGRDELAGSDVILAHRLLKGAAASTRRAGFVEFTAAAATALGVADDGAAAHLTETFDHVGTVDATVVDLDARWTTERDVRRVELDASDTLLDIAALLPAPPADCWAYLTSPKLRARWEGPISFAETSPTGRRGVGTTTECVTGRLATLEEVVDWQPYDHVAWRLRLGGSGPIDASADLEGVADGTRLSLRWARPSGADSPELVEAAAARREAIDRLIAVLGRADGREEVVA